jgi:hypothetical protein
MQTLTAKNLGFIAKLNKADRIPSRDTKWWDMIQSLSMNEINIMYNAWLEGWDSANTEYKKYNRKSKN